MFRFFGLGAMLFAVASTGVAGEHYVEIWNPPEARTGMPPRASAVRRPAAGKRVGARAVTVHARRAPAPVAKLATKTDMQENAPVHAPDMSGIPRQITPEGNVLRVSARGVKAEVMR
ncbi:hypothetical protein CJU94_17560 [Paraburkholderia aromaticivorans]|uniref:Uncharacterized protein n=2 Tax=Paraburkholderia aromaticivorans TaxID=2026199 RepID=A0A248VL90_9BURK|nr:hypothetical protein CJU94_17560 [Paraburkholderia aromaticivorans]